MFLRNMQELLNRRAFRRACWCGNDAVSPFSDDYSLCQSCGTLVLQKLLPSNIEDVSDDADDLYGKNYYLKHLVEDYGYPAMSQRMRADLPGRCIHWLKTLLKYKEIGAKVLEIGCGHGGSVALFRAAGYEATGLELSPWLVAQAKKMWNVPMLQGTVERQNIPENSLDAILMMDVLEHLEHPISTLRHCVRLLKSDGIFIKQTPKTPDAPILNMLEEEKSPFLVQLKSSEHIYLYSSDALQEIFSRCGARRFIFEPAAFAHYDQYGVAYMAYKKTRTTRQIESGLARSSTSRLVMALLDVSFEKEAEGKRANSNEKDACLRLVQIEKLTELVKNRETETQARMAQIDELTKLLSEANEDRRARLAQIEELTKQLIEANQDRQARMVQIEELTKLLIEANQDRQARMVQIEELTRLLTEANQDRKARMMQIEELTKLLMEADNAKTAKQKQTEAILMQLIGHNSSLLAESAQIELIINQLKT